MRYCCDACCLKISFNIFYSTYEPLTLWECEWHYETLSTCIQCGDLEPLQTGFLTQCFEVRNLSTRIVKYRYSPSKVTQWNLPA